MWNAPMFGTCLLLFGKENCFFSSYLSFHSPILAFLKITNKLFCLYLIIFFQVVLFVFFCFSVFHHSCK